MSDDIDDIDRSKTVSDDIDWSNGKIPVSDEWKKNGVRRHRLRLRVENQLGCKMVRWIDRIEFLESDKSVGEGQGGNNSDAEYFDRLPTI